MRRFAPPGLLWAERSFSLQKLAHHVLGDERTLRATFGALLPPSAADGLFVIQRWFRMTRQRLIDGPTARCGGLNSVRSPLRHSGLRPPSGQPIKCIPKQAGHPRRAQRIRRQLRQTFSELLCRQHGSGCADLITGTDRRTMILGGTDEPTIWPPVAYHDPHIDRPNSPPVSRAYCGMWCGICLRLPARKAAAS